MTALRPAVFSPPHDWAAVDAEIERTGAAIVAGLVEPHDLAAVNEQVDRRLATGDRGRPDSGSPAYDDFLGHRTVRFHGLIEKFPATAALIGDPRVVDWARRLIGPISGDVVLNAAELIEIGPGEPKQPAHRDSDSWPELPLGPHPIIVNAIVALDPFTEENGATHIAPGSHRWDRARRATADEYLRAVMDAGDAAFFRGDLIHRGGANGSNRPRRAVSLSYCAGWIRPVENSFLNVSRRTAASLSPTLRSLLGYRAHDSSYAGGGMVGLYENGDPARALDRPGADIDAAP